MNTPYKVGYNEVVDLRKEFPISWKYSFRQNIKWLVFFCAVIWAFVAIEHSPWIPAEISDFILRFRTVIFKGLAIILFFKVLHSELYRLTFYYGTEGFRLVVSRGIILKQEGSLPLLPISEILIDRDYTDLACGLCNLNVYTPMDQSREFARIECLDSGVAEDMQHFLNDILTTQIFIAPEALEAVTQKAMKQAHDQSATEVQGQSVHHAIHHASHDKGASHHVTHAHPVALR